MRFNWDKDLWKPVYGGESAIRFWPLETDPKWKFGRFRLGYTRFENELRTKLPSAGSNFECEGAAPTASTSVQKSRTPPATLRIGGVIGTRGDSSWDKLLCGREREHRFKSSPRPRSRYVGNRSVERSKWLSPNLSIRVAAWGRPNNCKERLKAVAKV